VFYAGGVAGVAAPQAAAASVARFERPPNGNVNVGRWRNRERGTEQKEGRDVAAVAARPQGCRRRLRASTFKRVLTACHHSHAGRQKTFVCNECVRRPTKRVAASSERRPYETVSTVSHA